MAEWVRARFAGNSKTRTNLDAVQVYSPPNAPKVTMPVRLTVSETATIKIELPHPVPDLQVIFRFNQERLWVSGTGRLVDSAECAFDCPRGDPAGGEWEFTIGAREATAETKEPLDIFYRDRHHKAVFDNTPGILMVAPRTAGREKPPNGPKRVSATALKILTAISIPTLVSLLTLMPDFRVMAFISVGHYPRWLPSTWEFRRNDNIADKWNGSRSWKEDSIDVGSPTGPIRIIEVNGSTPGWANLPSGTALYDFTAEFRIWLRNGVNAGWVLRSQADPRRGYSFTLVPDGKDLLLKGQLVGNGKPSWFGTRRLPYDDCCDKNDGLRFLAAVRRDKASFQVRRVNFSNMNVHGAAEDYSPIGTFDLPSGFRFGQIGFFSTDARALLLEKDVRLAPDPSLSWTQLLQRLTGKDTKEAKPEPNREDTTGK